MIYLFLRSDEYLLAQRLAAIKAALGDPEMASLNTSELIGSQTSAGAVLAEAAMMPFLAERRLLIVRGLLDHLDKRMAASKEPTSAAHTEAARLLADLPHVPDTCDIVLIDHDVDKRRALWKGFTIPAKDGQPERKIAGLETLSKEGAIKLEELGVPDPRALPGWINQRAKEKKIAIDGRAVQMLAEFVGGDLRRLDNELEKLTCYTGGQMIAPEAVKLMVSDASEAMIWELTDALSQRNGRGAIQALYELRQGTAASNSGNPFYLLTMIARQYRTIIKVKDALRTVKGDENVIAKTVGESPYPVKKAMQQATRYSFTELENIFERLLTADFAMKTGADQDTTIDVLVAELTQKTEGVTR